VLALSVAQLSLCFAFSFLHLMLFCFCLASLSPRLPAGNPAPGPVPLRRARCLPAVESALSPRCFLFLLFRFEKSASFPALFFILSPLFLGWPAVSCTRGQFRCLFTAVGRKPPRLLFGAENRLGEVAFFLPLAQQ